MTVWLHQAQGRSEVQSESLSQKYQYLTAVRLSRWRPQRSLWMRCSRPSSTQKGAPCFPARMVLCPQPGQDQLM